MATSNDYLNALQVARQKGDMEAVSYFRQKAAETARIEDRAKYAPEAPRGMEAILANTGAALHSIGQGAGQTLSEFTPLGQGAKMLGLTLGPSGVDVAESNRIKQQLGRDTLGGYGGALQFAVEAAPGFAFPMSRAASIANLARSGAVAGGVGSLLQPTENENVAQGKLGQAALGTALGGGAGAVIGGIPVAARAVRQRFAPTAEEMLADAVRRGGQTPAQAAAAIAAQRGQQTLGGAQLPTAAASENRGLMELEKALSGNITESRAALAQAETAANAQRARGLEQALGTPADAAQAREAARSFFQTELQNTPLQSYGADLLRAHLRRLAEQQGDPAVARSLHRILTRLDYAAERANAEKSWAPLLDFRRTALDDVVNRLSQTDTNAANKLRDIINNQNVRDLTDDVLLQASGGASSRVVGTGSRGHQLLTEAEQREAAQELRRAIELGAPTSGGDPSLVAGAVQRRLQQLQQQPRTNFGSAVLTDDAARAVDQMSREAALLRRSKAPDITGNVPASTRQAMEGVENPRTGWYMSGAGAAALVGHPVVAGTVILAKYGLNTARAGAMRDLTRMMSDSGYARNVLEELARRGASQQEIGIVREVLQRGVGGAAGASQ